MIIGRKNRVFLFSERVSIHVFRTILVQHSRPGKRQRRQEVCQEVRGHCDSVDESVVNDDVKWCF